MLKTRKVVTIVAAMCPAMGGRFSARKFLSSTKSCEVVTVGQSSRQSLDP